MGTTPHRTRRGPSVTVEGGAHSPAEQATPKRGRREAFESWRRLALFTAATIITSLPVFSPSIGTTEIRLIWVPLALLSFAFTWFPRREAPLYALIYAAVTLAHESHLHNLGFDLTFVLLEIGQALALAALVPRHLTRKQMILQPVRVLAYIAAALLITLVGATLSLLAAFAMGLSPHDFGEELGGNAALAWRYWWLGHACAFVTITGTLTFLRQVTRKDWGEILDRPRERWLYLLLALLQVGATLLVLPVVDLSWVGLPPDVRLGLLFIPVMTAIIITNRFRGFGASVAILTTTAIAILSVGGPYAAQNWAGLPSMATPVHLILIVIAAVCWALATTLRHLQWAIRDAVEASEAKSRFIALMSHELRTPLNAILGFSELMRMQSLRELGKEVASLDNIHASGQRLLAMVDAVLSHAGEGETIFELHKEPIHLRSAVEGAVDELADESRKCDCPVELNIPLDMFLDADPRALRQILQVLIGKSLRQSRKRNTISIVAHHDGTDSILEIRSGELKTPLVDDHDKAESHLVNALVLAHGARLSLRKSQSGRVARLRFFATRAAG